MLFTIIIIIAIIVSVFLALIVLVQNPKGGGLSGTFGGAANQIFGYKRTTDDIEKITWGLVVVVFALCLTSAALLPTETQTIQNGFGPEAKPLSQPMQTQPQPESQDPSITTPIETEGTTEDPQ